MSKPMIAITTRSSINVMADLLAPLAAIATPVIGGVLLALSLPPDGIPCLAWFALVPIGVAVTMQRYVVELYVGTFIGGLAFHLWHFDWLRTINDNAHVHSWVLHGTVLGITWVIAILVARVLRSATLWPMSVCLPLIWVCYELSRSNLSSLVVDSGYPWGQAGLSQVDNPLMIQIADVSGVYGVSFLLATCNGFIADVIRRDRILTSAMLCVAIVGVAIAYGLWRLPFDNIEGPLVALAPEAMERVMLQGRPDVVVWPEGSCGVLDQDAIAKWKEYAQESGAVTVVGGTRTDAEGSYNSAAVIEPSGVVGFYDKINLIPFEEFVPHGNLSLGESEALLRGRRFPTFPVGDKRMAITICYDVSSPVIYRSFMQTDEPPDFFVVAGYERADTTNSFQKLLLASARFRAVECRRCVIRNAAGGYSGLIDTNGRYFASDDAVPMFRVAIDNRNSLYCLLGDWLPWSSLALIFLVIARGRYRAGSRRLAR